MLDADAHELLKNVFLAKIDMDVYLLIYDQFHLLAVIDLFLYQLPTSHLVLVYLF